MTFADSLRAALSVFRRSSSRIFRSCRASHVRVAMITAPAAAAQRTTGFVLNAVEMAAHVNIQTFGPSAVSRPYSLILVPAKMRHTPNRNTSPNRMASVAMIVWGLNVSMNVPIWLEYGSV